MQSGGSDDASDPYATVAYRTDRAAAAHVPFALALCALGLVAFAFPDGTQIRHRIGGAILIAAGLGWIAYTLYRRRHPSKPRFELSPRGVLFRIPALREKRIPWREVAAVETIDVATFFPSLVRPRRVHFRNVTALRVSRAFYDTHLHEPSLFMRGPFWSTTFLVDEHTAKVALHHEALDLPADGVHAAVEARWRAFNPEAAALIPAATAGPADSNGAARTVQSPPSGLSVASAWYSTKIVVMSALVVALLANILGYWQTDAQRVARAEREKWQAEVRRWEEEDRRSAEERRKKDREWEEFWRKQNF